MTRSSVDHIDCDGITFHGYDYDLQVWVEDYIVWDMSPEHAGKDIRNIPGHSIRCPGCGGSKHKGWCE